MSQKFQASVQHRGDVSYVKLGGVIDEDNELTDLVDKIPAGTAVIDLGEIERINSCGVRDWVNWLSKLETNGTRSVLVECSPAIVAQINLVNNFTGNRKSTRLNSSHVEISYAVFCLKKKNKQYTVLDTA